MYYTFAGGGGRRGVVIGGQRCQRVATFVCVLHLAESPDLMFCSLVKVDEVQCFLVCVLRIYYMHAAH